MGILACFYLLIYHDHLVFYLKSSRKINYVIDDSLLLILCKKYIDLKRVFSPRSAPKFISEIFIPRRTSL